MANNEVYNVHDLAIKLNSNDRTIRELIKNGQLKAFKKLNKWYILHEDLIAYITTTPTKKETK